jgi:hypothetical protein
MPDTDAFGDIAAYKCIYAFTIHDTAHDGHIKIGEATVRSNLPIDQLPPNSRPLNEASRSRIDAYTQTAGVEYTLLYTELAVKQILDEETGALQLEAFHDHDVHRVLENSGIHAETIGRTTGKEWFEVDLPTVKRAIAAVKGGAKNLSGTGSDIASPIVFRPEQEKAIDMTVKVFGKSNRMLWNAKMRFGKTLSALEVVKRMGFRKTIIMTHRPVVDDGWYGDFGKIFHEGDGYRYGSKGHGYELRELLEGGGRFVWFASIQDLRGSAAVGGKFDKNADVFDTVWDFVIVDEAHEGTKTPLGDSTIRAVLKPDGPTKLLALSGTPFNILDEYDEAETYTWDYVMEQEAKSTWDVLHFGDSNPYEDLPQLAIYTYDLGDVFKNEGYIALDDKAFNFAEFFRVGNVGRFVHEPDVRSFLDLLCKSDPASNYPFSQERYRKLFRHTLWMVPGVRAAKALKSLMLQHPVFGCGQFDIVNVAGNGDEESEDALEYVQHAIRDADMAGTYTITLSCGRLTTGVTVSEWTAVLMLSGSYSTSAANYLQTIFRVQSPCKRGGKVKERAYVFDFAPDRTLKMVAKAVSVSAKAGHTSDGDRAALGKFLNFCPVIGIDGSRMERYDAGRLLRQLKRAWADAVVRNGFEDPNLYNQELLNLSNGDLKDFDDLKKIVGASKPSKTPGDIPINDQGLTDEERERVEQAEKKKKKDLTPEEQALLEKLKKAKEQRKTAISILAGISVRMPLLIYGADVPYESDITLNDFVNIVDDNSWEEFMPKGVTKRVFRRFIKYYDEDVFVAAGRRIRNIARHADTLPPTERTIEIAHLFSFFKNPDKETVLTPWRVVNMHISDMLGGWDFWDESHTKELEQPRFVDRGDITQEVFFGNGSRILEINSKTGLYPLYMAYSLFRARMGNDMANAALLEQRDVWNQVIRYHVFVICKTPMAKAITRRTLVGYGSTRINMHYVEGLDNIMANKRQQLIRKVSKGSYWDNQFGGIVEFSAIVGNPPYQKVDGGHGNSAMPVYQDFVQTAIDLGPEYVSMVTPSRWFSGGKGLDDYRGRMLHDHHLRELVDFPKLYEPFPNVKIRGGISYFLWDRSWNGPCTVQTMEDGLPVGKPVARYLDEFDVLIRRNEAVPILEKVLCRSEPKLSSRVSSSKPFGLRTFFHGADSPNNLREPVELYCSQNISWIERGDVPTHRDWIDKWKVLVTTVQGTSAAVETKFLSTPIVAGEGTACTETYLVAGLFDSKDQALGYTSYLRTRFVRFLISLRKPAQHVTKDTFAFVPDLSYDHEWSDEALYERYELDDSEIAFIESVVKPMDE